MLPRSPASPRLRQTAGTAHLNCCAGRSTTGRHAPVSLTGSLAPFEDDLGTLAIFRLTSWRYLHGRNGDARALRKLAIARGFRCMRACAKRRGHDACHNAGALYSRDSHSNNAAPHGSASSRRDAPELVGIVCPRKNRGRRETGARRTAVLRAIVATNGARKA